MRAIAIACLVSVSLWSFSAGAEIKNPEYMLLKNDFGELCTMCEATVVCSVGPIPPPPVEQLERENAGPYWIYHFHTKTFWGQIGTIWDYMVRWIEPVVRENRPVTIYKIPEAGIDSADRVRVESLAYLSTEPAEVAVSGRTIDRWSREWHSEDGSVLGSCARLPLRETWPILTAREPWPEGQEPMSEGDMR